MSLGIPWHTC